MVVACLGEALIDLVPPAGESPRDASHFLIQPGGAPLNICIGLSRLGCDSRFLGCLSDDAFGQRLATLMKHEQIVRWPTETVANPTRLAVVDQTNPRTPFRLYGDFPADSSLTPLDINRILDTERLSGLYVGSLMMTNERGAGAQRYAIERSLALEIPIYTDPNPRPSAWPSDNEMVKMTRYLLGVSSLAKLSLDDAGILGWPTDPGDLIKWCWEQFNTRLFVTGGSDGCWASIDGHLHHEPALAIKPVDPTGAGDASFSALIVSVRRAGGLTRDGLRIASAAGAITTLSRGAISAFPRLDQIEEFLEKTG